MRAGIVADAGRGQQRAVLPRQSAPQPLSGGPIGEERPDEFQIGSYLQPYAQYWFDVGTRLILQQPCIRIKPRRKSP
ncbi:hypothetical protein BK670_11220 [Pseudomonas fluorescens]|uniref:Uncharacterized protein n=1 Tax=Pseudomonas fluorescens TaxID=294 RepID=A0A423MBX9_PSEFL|nr:hypothetical protein BK670_11220 [Pseudomonas fluorescens]